MEARAEREKSNETHRLFGNQLRFAVRTVREALDRRRTKRAELDVVPSDVVDGPLMR